MAESFGFDEEYYLEAKLNAIKDDPQFSSITDTSTLKSVMAQQGMTPLEHYKLYGNSENISTSAYFNKAEYLTAKLLALRESAETSAEWANKSITDLENVMAQQGMTPAEHYSRYGYAETRADGTLINPSNAFDANAYFAAKLAELQKTNPEQYANASVLDVLNIFQEQHIDPVSHYLNYGASEAVISGTPMVQTVPTSQRMPEDPDRAVQGTLVPDNPSKPSLPPSKALPIEVPQPGDMGGHNYETVLPPAKEPVPTPEIPGITPKPEDPGTGGDSGGSSGSGGDTGSGDSGGSSGGSSGGDSGGGDSGGTGSGGDTGSGDSGGSSGGGSTGGGGSGDGGYEPPVQPPLPTGEPIILTERNATVTQLTSINAGGRQTADNRSDIVEMKTVDALNAILDGGTCNDGRGDQENDTLIISASTNGTPTVNYGIMDLSVTNFESIVLGDGVQKIRPGDYDKHNNYSLKNVTFDDKDDVLDLSGMNWGIINLSSITTKDKGQGNIIFHPWSDNYNDTFASLNLADVQWTEGSSINSIQFVGAWGVHFVINNAGLAKVSSIVDEANTDFSTLQLRGEIKAIDGKGQILDSNVKNFYHLNLESATLADDVTSLDVNEQYSRITMDSSQWNHLQTLSTKKQGAELILYHDWEAQSPDKLAVDTILSEDTVAGFGTLSLYGMEGLDKLDTTASSFDIIKLDTTTASLLAEKNIIGKAEQELYGDNIAASDAFSALGAAKGFTSLFLNTGWVQDKTTWEMEIASGTSIKNITVENHFFDAKHLSLHIVDNSTTVNTINAHGDVVLLTDGIEHIHISDYAHIDASSFLTENFKIDGNGRLSLHGTVSSNVLAGITNQSGTVTGIYWLDLANATLDSAIKTIDATEFISIEVNNQQAAGLTVNNAQGVIIHGANTKTADLAGLVVHGLEGATKTIIISGTYINDDINMTDYAEDLTINGGRGTLIGGENNDVISSNGYGTQKGGAGNDTLSIYVYPDEKGTVVQDGGAGNDSLVITVDTSKTFQSPWTSYEMTGGAGWDRFEVSWNMDKVSGLAEGNSGVPDIRLEITDFQPTVSIADAGEAGKDYPEISNGSNPTFLRETLNISNIHYGKVNDGVTVDEYYTIDDFIATKAEIGNLTDLSKALNKAAETITANKIGVFEIGNDTYIFGNNTQGAVDRGDLVIKLTGVDADALTADNFIFHA